MTTHKHPDNTYTVTFQYAGKKVVHTGGVKYLAGVLQRNYGIWWRP